MIKRHFKLILAIILMLAGLLGIACAAGFPQKLFKHVPTEEELLASVPKLDTSKYNRFTFKVAIDVGNADGDGKEFTQSGPVEIYRDISHLYDQDVYFRKSGYKTKGEGWTDFATGGQYKDVGQGDGWVKGEIKDPDAIGRLADVINNRNNERTLTIKDDICTLSWKFEADLDYLFGRLMSGYTEDLDLSGYGRATAVFNPETYKFEYFTFIISANNKENAGGMLDSVFHWKVVNDENKKLAIPEDIINEVYAKETGIKATGGYDPDINPMAEGFISEYGGSAETTCSEGTSSMFWTAKDGDMSASVNYMKTNKPKKAFKENYEFLTSMYGEPAETSDSEAYFYDAKSGTLTCMAKGNGWYAQITVTGQPGTSQGSLRKKLITYYTKLGI